MDHITPSPTAYPMTQLCQLFFSACHYKKKEVASPLCMCK
jgi:hypothetical protein